MNSKAFRRNPGPKPKCASSTFISLHFNKSDEDQLEISYKNDQKVTEGTNFYIAKEEVLPLEVGVKKNKSSVEISNKFADGDVLEESAESKFSKKIRSSQCHVETNSGNFQPERIELNEDDIELKLSPAIEASEVVDSDSFNHHINDELEKAKCKILEKESFISSPNHSETNADCNSKTVKNCNYFYSIMQNSIILMKYAQNSMKFHIFIAVLACVCAPIPSWLSGFLVGAILSCSLTYWLYKPQKNKRNFYNFNFVSSQDSNFQKESGILKGWMNELPSFISYSPQQYHVSSTRSVYVRLEGSYLRFSFPQKNLPKRAMFNEPRCEMQFIYQQHYDITDATVELLPQGLSRKRLWSKKYPICLKIPNCKGALLSKSLQDSFSAKTNKKGNLNRKFMPRINENNEIVICLFSRTDREKSLWFTRFLRASKMKIELSHSPTLGTRTSECEFFENKRNMSVDFSRLQNTQRDDEVDDNFVNISFNRQQKFEMYMSTLLAPLHTEHPLAMKKDPTDKREAKTQTWLNVLIGRLFFDFLIEDVWAQHVSAKVQKKLNRIKLPFFLSELTVKDINLGSALPKVHSTSDPSLDERGLWIDMDVSYNGSFHMTLETKLNLDRFKTDSETLFTHSGHDPNEDLEQTKLCVSNSDEDSLESSSDDEYTFPETNEDISVSSGSTSKKLIKLVDKLAQSSYFQHAAKNKYVKRAMDDIVNTPLILTVEVQWLTGTLAINIPPWPTDRLWYGFRTNPSLSITARPKLGQHVVTFTQVTEWIEKKLTSEFQKVLVMPNMDDLIIPIMQPCHDIS